MAVWTPQAIASVRARFSGSSILVDTNTMVAKATVVSSVISDLERTFDELQRVVGRTSSYWVGEAGNHHRRMFEDEREDISYILVRLKEHPEDLKLMANNFETTERGLTEVNRSLRTDYI